MTVVLRVRLAIVVYSSNWKKAAKDKKSARQTFHLEVGSGKKVGLSGHDQNGDYCVCTLSSYFIVVVEVL